MRMDVFFSSMKTLLPSFFGKHPVAALFLALFPLIPLHAQDTLATIDTSETINEAVGLSLLRGWVLVQLPPTGSGGPPVPVQASHDLFHQLAKATVQLERERLDSLARPDRDVGLYLIYDLVKTPDGDVVPRVDLRMQAPVVPIRTPAPKYPRDAFLTGKEGEVHVEITVARNGNVVRAEVLQATPREIFNGAALSAVKRWEFQPFPADDPSVAYRDIYVIDFRLQ